MNKKEFKENLRKILDQMDVVPDDHSIELTWDGEYAVFSPNRNYMGWIDLDDGEVHMFTEEEMNVQEEVEKQKCH